MADEGLLRITVLCSPAPRTVRAFELQLGVGANVADALIACNFWREFAPLDTATAGIAIWGRRAAMSRPLRDGDRIEVCRPLVVDPKIARRERFARQGSRTSGLFSKRRAAAKPGY
ncbi:MAG: RnfH family protein [Burkholderiales bacterium]